VDDVREDARPVDGREEGHGAPCEGVVVARHAEDAKMRRWGEIFDCHTHVRGVLSHQKKGGFRLPVIEPPTAPHPVSPKFERTLCRRAA